MPRHRRGIEHITFFGDEFAGVLKLSFDVPHLYDQPFRRSGVHVAKDGVLIEGGARSTTAASTPCCSIPAGRCATAAPPAASTSTATAACIERVVGIGEPIKGIGKQM